MQEKLQVNSFPVFYFFRLLEKSILKLRLKIEYLETSIHREERSSYQDYNMMQKRKFSLFSLLTREMAKLLIIHTQDFLQAPASQYVFIYKNSFIVHIYSTVSCRLYL